MSTTLLELIESVAALFGHLHGGTAASGTVRDIVDQDLIDPDDFWINHYAYITDAVSAVLEGQERAVSDYVQSTQKLTVAPDFSAAVEAGDTYLLLPMRRVVFVRAIESGIDHASEQWGIPTIDTSTVTIAAGAYQYTLPSDLIWLEDVLYRGATDAPWRTIRRDSWSVAGTPGTQVLDLIDLPFTVGDNLRLDYIARLPKLAADADELAIGGPAEAELIDFLVQHALWYLHTQEASRNVSAGTFREHLTMARGAREAAEAALKQAPRWQRTGRWHIPERQTAKG